MIIVPWIRPISSSHCDEHDPLLNLHDVSSSVGVVGSFARLNSDPRILLASQIVRMEPYPDPIRSFIHLEIHIGSGVLAGLSS